LLHKRQTVRNIYATNSDGKKASIVSASSVESGIGTHSCLGFEAISALRAGPKIEDTPLLFEEFYPVRNSQHVAAFSAGHCLVSVTGGRDHCHGNTSLGVIVGVSFYWAQKIEEMQQDDGRAMMIVNCSGKLMIYW